MERPRGYGIPIGHQQDRNEYANLSQTSGHGSWPRRPAYDHPLPDPSSGSDPFSQSSQESTRYQPMSHGHSQSMSNRASNMDDHYNQRNFTQPYRDIDNLYSRNAFRGSDLDVDDVDEGSSPVRTRSFQRHEQQYHQPHFAPATPERSRLGNESRSANSLQASAVPLMAEYAPTPPHTSPYQQKVTSGTALNAVPGQMYETRLYTGGPSRNSIPPPNRLDRGIGMYGDDYDGGIWDPNNIVEDDDEVFHQPKRNSRFGKIPSAQSLAFRTGILGGSMNSRERMENFSNADEITALGAEPLNAGSQNNHHHTESRTNLGTGQELEKSEWLKKERGGAKRLKWIVGVIIGILIIAAIVGGVVGGILGSRKSSGSSSTSQHHSSSKGLYDINSSQVKAVLNNKDLHRVFPGMDYTPLNAQYPDCLTNPPDQNNVTLDVATLAQLTPAIRLYGTDCGQIEMVLRAIDLLGYNDTLKVWIGVWLGRNTTTNTRQLDQMYDILDQYSTDHFAGLIVGNEVLFREDLTIAELGAQLSSVRSNLTAKNIDLPVATSDLGDDWTSALVTDTDIVMANIHPFFAGVTPDVASGWSWDFWQNHNVALTSSSSGSSKYPKNIISEIGWPSEGGNDCGTAAGCPNDTAGAVASVDNMNTFMEGWICPSMANATTYFWFEAFDEPWKAIFNTDKDQWETKWGLMDENRKLKKGLKIPDCDGKTIDKPY